MYYQVHVISAVHVQLYMYMYMYVEFDNMIMHWYLY